MPTIRQTDAFAAWFAGLRDRQARARIDVRIRRLSLGNPGQVRVLTGGVAELKIDYGPGYRIYFVQRGAEIVILLCGGDKRTRRAISSAPSRWRRRCRMPLDTRPWDVAEHLQDEASIAAYIEAVLEDGDPALVAAAIGDVARARGMAQIAQETGRSRESLYRALSERGNPQLDTLMSVLKAIGLRLSVKPAEAP